MFSLCEGMKWSHLPLGGGLYDQDPELLDGFKIIFWARAQHEAREEKKRAQESRNKKPARIRGGSRTR